jgi:hypothetical protein
MWYWIFGKLFPPKEEEQEAKLIKFKLEKKTQKNPKFSKKDHKIYPQKKQPLEATIIKH